MPIRQPIQTTIHTGDFRDNTYCFAVESVIDSQEHVGMLTVSTSAGYWLFTSLNKELRREHTFEHIQQTDGSWIANGNVTLVVAGDSPVSGTIVIRNSLAETVVLIVSVTSIALIRSEQPSLMISQPTLAFAQTAPGKPSFLVLTIAQQHTNEPIMLTTDAPEYFQLASDSRPSFSPSLTLTPSTTGTYVHVRYSARKSGLHTGQLIIHNSYEKKAVVLEGRSKGLLPVLHKPQVAVSPTPLRRPNPNRLVGLKRWGGVLAVIIASGLAYTGYVNRCQFFPILCSDSGQRQTRTQPTLSVSVPLSVNDSKAVVSKPATIQATMPSTSSSVVRAKPNLAANAPIGQTRPIVLSKADQTQTDNRKVVRFKQETGNQANIQTSRQKIPASPTEESDLERELNRNL